MAEVRQCASFLSLSLHNWIFQAHHARSQNLDDFLAGWLSGVAGLALTQPVDVVKTRMMTQAASTAAPYADAVDCVRTMARTEGLTAFYKGLPQRIAYAGPLWAMQLGLNTQFTALIRDRKAVAMKAQATSSSS